MSKRKKLFSKPTQPAQLKVSAMPPDDSPLSGGTPANLPAAIDELHSDALNDAAAHQIGAQPLQPTPEKVNLAEAWKKAAAARQVWVTLRQGTEELQKTYESRLSELDSEKEQLSLREQGIKTQDLKLHEWEIDLRARELNAETGFLSQKREAFTALEHEVDELKQQLAELSDRLASEYTKAQTSLLLELDRERSSHRELLDQEKQQFEDYRQTQHALLAREWQEVNDLRGKISEAELATALAKEQQFRLERELQIAQEAEEKYKEAFAQAEDRRAQHERLLLKVKADQSAVQQSQSDNELWQATNFAKERQLQEWETTLQLREQNAAAGFLKERQTVLSKFITELEHTRVEEQNRFEVQEQRLLTQDQERQQHWVERDQNLHDEQQILQQSQRKLKREQLEYEAEKQMLAEDKVAFGQTVERLAAAKVGEVESLLNSVRETLSEVTGQRDQLWQLLSKREESDRRFGHRSPEEIMQEINRLTSENRSLQDKLNAMPSIGEAERLRQFETENDALSLEVVQLRQQRQQLQRDLGNARIGVVELETLRDQKTSLESKIGVYQQTLREVTQDLKREMEVLSEHPIFPECIKMDENVELQESPSTDEISVGNLTEFAKKVRQCIAYDAGDSEKRLFYDEIDIRSFLGGLAMGQLIILQGISGTGKTSLPIAFARAVGGGPAIRKNVTLVEVQAGWRDRQDLIGHYNSFKDEFYELKFMRALYEAQCPYFQDQLYFIVLDEMNLSYPEQYFADMLSALEQPEQSERKIEVMPRSIDLAHARPKRFMPDGRSLAIPTNVWFVGTANQDETTKTIADKTYDRAHIMELKNQGKPFERNANLSASPRVSFQALTHAFTVAQRSNELKKAANRSYDFINKELRSVLGSQFKIGWGNRLERQIMSYVPVVIGAGGSLGEATDHILAMKVLRKVRGRYDNREDDLNLLKKQLEDNWLRLAGSDEYPYPARSLEIVDEELRRLKPLQ